MKHTGGFARTRKFLIGVMDIIVFHISIIVSFLLRYNFTIPVRNYNAYESAAPFIIMAFIFLNILFGLYIFYNKSKTDFIYLTLIVQFFMAILIMAMTFFGRWFAFPRSIVFVSFIVSTILLSFWRILIFKVYQKVDGTKKVMVVGTEKNCKRAIRNFEGSKNNRHKITIAVVNDYFNNIKKNMDTVDIVYLADQIEESERIKIYNLLIRSDKKLFLSTDFENLVLVNPNIMNIEDESIIEASSFKISPEEDAIKRFIDFIISLILLIIASPIMLVTALLVKVTSKGPVLYKQVRITKEQKEFNMLKFRTMSATAEKESGPVLASANDTRITPVGKYLRSLRIDELPQLINVLKGDMSLVGPRPERPFFVDQFNEENEYYYLRHNIRAGITGNAQVYGKYASDYNSKLNFDLLYIKKYSLIFDLKILLQTIKILFDKVSSQGVEEEDEELVRPIPDDIRVLD